MCRSTKGVGKVAEPRAERGALVRASRKCTPAHIRLRAQSCAHWVQVCQGASAISARGVTPGSTTEVSNENITSGKHKHIVTD